MQFCIQEKFESKIRNRLSALQKDEVLNGNASVQVFIGDLQFISSQVTLFDKNDFVALVAEEAQLPAEQISLYSEKAHFVVTESSHLEDVIDELNLFVRSLVKKNEILLIRANIQKKRRELEELNERLNAESQKKIVSLEQSHQEEHQKNQNEKRLLHFLDFIQSESVSDDFLIHLMKFLWKELKKVGRFYQIGFMFKTSSGTSNLMAYDGATEHYSHVDFQIGEQQLSSQFALLWGRPVGKIHQWRLPDCGKEGVFFVEVIEPGYSVSEIEDYLEERLAVLSLYLDRWMIEKEFELIVSRWDRMFKSFSGFVHLIDENFQIYQSNYSSLKNSQGEQKCYEVLAGRKSVCEKCPILKNQMSDFFLKDLVKVRTFFSEFKYNTKKYYFVIYEDITQIEYLKSQMVHAEKMSTLGRLGNHLAHELNNPLTGLKSYVQSLSEEHQNLLPQTIRSDLQEILKATDRCQKIIRNFIDFSQKKEPILEKIIFADVLQNTLILLKSALRQHRLFIDIKPVVVVANSHDLQQVLFNLIKNSCQAMLQPGVVKIYQEENDRQYIFSVEDSGPGFDESILKNIFHPFMTTKKQGEGTGLGLYLSKKMMNNMKADLCISSSQKQGAKISLVFDKI